MKLKAITGIVLTTLLLVVASPICISVGEGKRGGMLGQHESLQAYSYSEPPQTEWNRTYGGANPDFAVSVVETVDGGYALAGITESFGAGGSDFWLVKVDSFGIEQWNRTYGGTDSDSAYSVVETSDGGYALAGLTESFGAGYYDFWLVKVDSFGIEQWNRTYGGSELDDSNSVVETVDGGYALAGSTESFGAGYYDFWLVKVAGPPTPVGGILIPVDKFGLLAPYIALSSTILVATAATAIYVKRRKKKQ